MEYEVIEALDVEGMEELEDTWKLSQKEYEEAIEQIIFEENEWN